MARLNEDGAILTLESFETLKRRFLRQNRELAKANSAQSVRVRALEAEVAKLMSETITLKDTNHQLECELARHSESHPTKVQNIHDNLELKVGELSDLLRSLNGVYTRGERQAPTPERVRNIRPQQFRPWRAPRSSGGIQEFIDDRLPTLPEGTEYSQISLNLLPQPQVSELSAENSLSPEIGPPPVVHFDTAEIEEFIDLPSVSHTRRRKRESVNRDDVKRVLPLLNQPIPDEAVDTKPRVLAVSPRSRLKRKLDSRDEIIPSQENLPHTIIRDRGSASFTKTPLTIKDKPEEPAKLGSERRRALAPRNANIDPLSPKKLKVKAPSIKRPSTARALPEPPRPETPSQNITTLFSPPSIPESPLDTPPPTSDPHNNHNPSRAGRRSRGTVSYAEPNLRDKMRRPTKELVDAVTGEGRSKRLSSANVDTDFSESSIVKNEARQRTGDDALSPSTGREGERAGKVTVGLETGKIDEGTETSLAMAMKSLEVGDGMESTKPDSKARKDELARRREGRRRASSVFAAGKVVGGSKARGTEGFGRQGGTSAERAEDSEERGARRRSMAV
ncbi:MAG: hypothetical protein M1814_000332 [Vezdaea aestivalis]|nr:MAG: hypothetical protein M1814_000332 [Vezdaea aestivalis]